MPSGARHQPRPRLDAVVAEITGSTRTRAQAIIMAGRVTVDGHPAAKSGATVAPTARVSVADAPGFVSRGGAKLEKALDDFAWSVDGLKCLDVGASTGGFTDCLLQRGARSVTSVDVGYGQLAWGLRNDPRVTPVERCNFRLADPATLGAPFDFACADVSFISLAKLAAQFRACLRDGGKLIVLVKPQFEAGRSAVKRGGIVRDPAAQASAIETVARALDAAGLQPVRCTYSPIKGPAGNIEFLVGAQTSRDESAPIDAAGVVAAAHERLDL